ncbi:MAG: hypothetical protein U0234_10760 [Sandaracinus sp.]
MTPTSTLDAPAPSSIAPRDKRAMLALFAVWIALATAIGASGLYSLPRRALVPLTIVTLVVAQLVAYRSGVGALRRVADAIDLRWVALFQSVRAPIGATFLLLVSFGLDATFARVAGYGDLVSGLFALGLAIFAPRHRGVWLAWSIVGLGDILLVIATAQRILLFSDHPETMSILIGLPGAWLPTFLVPLVVSTHLLVLTRLRRAAIAR